VTWLLSWPLLGYRAPEVIAGEGKGTQCDMYALGIVLLHLLPACLCACAVGECGAVLSEADSVLRCEDNSYRLISDLAQEIKNSASRLIHTSECTHGTKEQSVLSAGLQFLSSCIESYPTQRLSSAQALAHLFLSDCDSSESNTKEVKSSFRKEEVILQKKEMVSSESTTLQKKGAGRKLRRPLAEITNERV